MSGQKTKNDGGSKGKWREWWKGFEKEWGYGVTFFILVGASAIWVWGFLNGHGVFALVGGSVVGGILYDVVQTKGRYVVPRARPDGIYLGSLYGAVVGFVVAMTILDAILPNAVPVQKSVEAFLVALGLKGGSEAVTSARLVLLKDDSYIKYDAGPFNQAKNSVTVNGKLILPATDRAESPMVKDKVIHIHTKSGGTENTRDAVTDQDGTFSYALSVSGPGDWESWASWDGDSDYESCESDHQHFSAS